MLYTKKILRFSWELGTRNLCMTIAWRQQNWHFCYLFCYRTVQGCSDLFFSRKEALHILCTKGKKTQDAWPNGQNPYRKDSRPTDKHYIQGHIWQALIKLTEMLSSVVAPTYNPSTCKTKVDWTEASIGCIVSSRPEQDCLKNRNKPQQLQFKIEIYFSGNIQFYLISSLFSQKI